MTRRVGWTIVIGTMLLAVVGPWIAADAYALDLAQRLNGPSWAHPFGVDELGRDVLARLVSLVRTPAGWG